MCETTRRRRGGCEIAKHGPVLTGRAGFTVRPDGDGAARFSAGMRKLVKMLAERSSAVAA